MEIPGGPSRRRSTRSLRRERRAARRAQVRAWQRKNACSLEAEWFLGNEEPSLFDELLAVGVDDAANLYISASMRCAFGALLPAIETQSGIFLVTGEAGIGKSMFAAQLGATLRAAGHLVVAANCFDMALDRWFATLAARSSTATPSANADADRAFPVPVLLADTAELLSMPAMRALPPRFESEAGASVRVVLIGRPALVRHIEDARSGGLKQLVRLHTRLEPLDENDILLFARQLTSSDRDGDPVSSEILAAMARYSQGRPANVRFLWTQARRIAKSDGESEPRLLHVEKAARMMLRPQAGGGHATSVGEASRSQVTAGRDGDETKRHRRPARFAARRVASYAATAAAFALLWFVTGLIDTRVDQPSGAPLAVQAQNTRQDVLDRPVQAVFPTYSSDAARDIDVVVMVSPPPDASSAPTTIAAADPANEERNASAGERTTEPSPPHQDTQAKLLSEPANTHLAIARLTTSPQPQHATPATPMRAPLALAAQAAKPSRPPADEARVMPIVAVVAAAEPQCQPYVSSVDYAGSSASVHGLACRDATGRLWLMDQRSE